jgi:hypothetical protein
MREIKGLFASLRGSPGGREGPDPALSREAEINDIGRMAPMKGIY